VTEQDFIREVVRGVRPWTDLGQVGIIIRLQGARASVDNTRRISASADAHDLAHGLLAYRADANALREWAFILEGGSSFLDLDVEDHPDGEVLLDGLWKACFGEPIPAEAVRAAEHLVAGEHTSA
jgi:hypothetical protein